MTKKKKEEINHDDTLSRGVFFQNYDLYDVGNPETSPGTGLYQNMDKYDSVEDFRNKKRKENMKKRRKAMFSALMVATAQDQNNLADPEKDESLTPPPELWNPAPPEGGQFGLTDDSSSELDYQDEASGNLYYGIMENHNIE